METPTSSARTLAGYVAASAPSLPEQDLGPLVAKVRDAFTAGTYSPEDWNAALGLEPANPLGTFLLRVLEDRASDNDVVLEASKRLETVLKERHGAAGRGLHEYTSDVEDALPEPVVKTLRWLATVRNNVVHGDVAGDGSGSGLDGIHQKARYVLQAGRSYDWLVKEGESENFGESEVLNSKRRISVKVNMVNPKVFLVAWLVLVVSMLFIIISWFNVQPNGNWNNHPNQIDNFWLGVVVFIGTLVLVALLPKKEHDFPFLEIEKKRTRAPSKGNPTA